MELNFDSTKVERIETSFEPIPDGKYKAMIINSERKTPKFPTDGNDGNAYLSITWQIVDGEYKNRLIFENLNLWRNGKSPSDPKTVNVAQSKLAEICDAVKVARLKRTEELHNKIICIKVTVRPPNGDYKASNDIKKYEPINGGSKLLVSEPETKPGSSLPWG